jgi:hypothetical protein
MFALDHGNVTLNHLNVRLENHGDKHEPALDLKLSLRGHAEVLELLDPALPPLLFGKSGPRKGQQGFEETTPPALRFPLIAGLKWGAEQTGCEVELSYGIDGSSAVRFASASINQFRVTFEEADVVELTFRVQTAIPDGALDKPKAMLGQSFPVRIEPPEIEPGKAAANA